MYWNFINSTVEQSGTGCLRPPQAETPNYKVVFYAHENYYEQDADGSKSGSGYEMMQNGSRYMQCTFSCVGYDKNIFPSRSILKILREL